MATMDVKTALKVEAERERREAQELAAAETLRRERERQAVVRRQEQADAGVKGERAALQATLRACEKAIAAFAEARTAGERHFESLLGTGCVPVLGQGARIARYPLRLAVEGLQHARGALQDRLARLESE